MEILKKTISIGLTATLSLLILSLNVFATPADIDGVVHEDEINVLCELGVFDDCDEFRPNDTVTRAEFSKIIYKISSKEPLIESESVFDDVPETHWAKDYINYCYENGFVTGTSDPIYHEPLYFVDLDEDGNIIDVEASEYKEEIAAMYDANYQKPEVLFSPEDDITIEQALKMLLVCLNYQAYWEKYGYPEGVRWASKQIGLTSGFSDYTKSLTRDEAAGLVYTALFIPLMEVSEYEDQTVYSFPNDENGVTLYQKVFGF